jgi:hypothetical protein
MSALSASLILGGFALIDRAGLGLLTEEEAVGWGSLVDAVGLVVVVLTIVTAVPFLTWLHRTVGNIPFLGGGVPRWSPTASMVWWFIPIAFAFMPYLVMRELKRRLRIPGVNTLIPIAIWWVAWIGAEFVARVASRGDPFTLDEIRASLAWSAFADALLAVAAVCAILVVRGLQSVADRRAEFMVIPLPPQSQAQYSGGQAAQLRELALQHRDGRISTAEYESRKAAIQSEP